MSNEITTYLKYAHLQIAAEAFYGLKGSNPGDKAYNLTDAILKDGNTRTSVFTETDAQWFAQSWEVVEHISNTTTGFSGTLFRALKDDPERGIVKDELVLSFRSTEFADDAARDNQATNVMEIKAEGWAFGQISDMRDWVDSLYASNKITAPVTVTGYSLGGHLATAFNLLYPGMVAATYTFNGAGVGTVAQGMSVTQAMDVFRDHRAQGSNADLFTDPDVLARYSSLKDLFKEGANVTLVQVDAALDGLDLLILGEQLAGKVEAVKLYDAMQRVRSVVYEAERVNAGVPSGTGSDAALHVETQHIAAAALDYQLAVLRAGEYTEGFRTGVISGGWDAYAGRTIAPGGAIAGFYDLYGAAPPSAVANSQLHYGTGVPIFIEDQPLYRGTVHLDVGNASWKAGEAKLLVDNFGLNDFGDTHSLVLIVDSLSVQHALARLAPEVTAQTLSGIFAAASNHKATELAATQGTVDGDTLETVVNALADTLGLGWTGEGRLEGDLQGNTWARVEDQDGYSGRATFHARLKALTDSPAYQALVGKVRLEGVSSASALAALAQQREDFSVIVALESLSPFVLRGADAAGETALQAVWQGPGWGERYTAWLADQELVSQDRLAQTYTDEWIADRADMLRWLSLRNTQDAQQAMMPNATEAVAYLDIETNTRFGLLRTDSSPSVLDDARRVSFGGALSDELGGSQRADHLYGGAGADKLLGLGGADHLEGGADDDELNGGEGNDTLVGGTGHDRYVFEGNWGTDTVIDSDGLGRIEVNGHVLTGGEQISANAWQSEDKQWRYALTEMDDLVITHAEEPGRIIVRGWSQMQGLDAPLGLDLPQAGAPGQPQPVEPGMYALQGDQLGPADSSWLIQADGSIPGAQPDPGANNLFDGGGSIYPDVTYRYAGWEVDAEGRGYPVIAYTRAVSYWGLGGNDFISGEQYDDYLDGGDGDDVIWGGAGSDTLYGGAGDDIIVSNMAASMPGGYGELPREADEIKGPDNVVTQTSGNNIIRWFVVRSVDGTWLRVERAHVKNPHGSDFYAPESESDQDVIDAGEGNDYVWAGRGADYLIGGAGDDHLAGLGGSDVILGGEGSDVIYGDEWVRMQLQAVYASRDTIKYGHLPLDDDLKSPALHGDDVIDAGAGDDEVWGDGGDDVIFGGSGADLLLGDAYLDELPIEFHGNDWMDGGEGDDILIGFGGSDTLLGGAGSDELLGDHIPDLLPGAFHGKDHLDGGEGDDLLIGGGNADVLFGGAGNDQLQGDASGLDGQFHGDDQLDGGDGDDVLFGQGGSDVIHGGAGDDIIEADDALNRLAAQFHGNDYVDGGDGNDNIAGGGGDDILLGGAGDDWIAGEDEIDVDSVSTLTGDDVIFGGPGSDTLVGGNGDDRLYGEQDDDWLYGGAGSDVLDGGTGRNVLKGGADDDLYVVTAAGTHIIDDTEGRNVVQGVDGMAVGATLQGDLVFMSAERTVVLRSAFLGGYAGDLLIGGEAVSVENFISANVVDPLHLASSEDNVRFLGGRGDDEIMANGAHAQVLAGRGDDEITFKAAGGRVVLNQGDGHDRVILLTSTQAAHKVDVQLGEGIAADDVWFAYDPAGNALRLHYSSNPDDVLEVSHGGAVPASVLDEVPVGEVRLSDGSVLAFDFVPRVADEDAPFAYSLPEGVFAGLGSGATLTASAAGGAGWPAWLHFDAVTRTFSGTPASEDVGSISIKVEAADGEDATTHSFVLVVRNVNDTPQGGTPLPAFTGQENASWFYDLPEGSFVDEDAGDTLTYTAKLSNGDPLPSWLAIDPESGRIQHFYGFAQATRLNIVVTATDRAGATAEQAFDLTVLSSIDSQAILGTPDDDVLTGGAGHEVLIGGYGNDILDGGAGQDLLIGGNANSLRGFGNAQGSDVYLFGRGNGHDEIWSGWSPGGATIQFKPGIDPGNIHTSRGPGDSIVFTIIDTGETLTIPDFHRDAGTGYNVIDFVKFSDRPETVWESDMIRRFALIGTHADDQIRGYNSADVLQGNSGNDTLWGGRGDDTYLYGKDDGVDLIWEAANAGNDRILMIESVAPGDVMLFKVFPEATPNGALIARVTTGSTEIEIRNFFNGNAQEGIEAIEFDDGTVWDRSYILSHTIGMSATADEMIGTPQDDQYVVDHRGDSILEAPGGGIDSVSSHVSYTLPVNVENLTLTGPLTINGTGNSGDNVIIGNDADNILNWGGGGRDILQGGLGNDTYEIMAPSTTLAYWPGIYSYASINESPGGGIDVLRTNLFRASLPENVENLIVPSFYASQIARNLSEKVVAQYTGNNGDNVLDVSAVSSNFLPIELDGGAGSDTLIGSVAGKADWAVYASATAGVSVSLLLKGPQDTLSSGLDTLMNIENLRGSNYSDVLTGDERDNSLDGGLGADIMIGGLGNDKYYVDNVDDLIVENIDEGVDSIYVTGQSEYVLQDHIENLDITAPYAASSVYVQGNDLDNTITTNHGGADEVVVKGMGGNDSLASMGSALRTELDGGDGDDRLTGGYGQDIFIGGTGDDVFFIRNYSGNDVIRAESRSRDPQETDTLILEGINFENLLFDRNANDLTIRWGNSYQVLVEKFFNDNEKLGDSNPLQVLWAGLTLTSMQSLNASDILARIHGNHAPVVVQEPGEQQVRNGEWFSWSPYGVFSDDGGESGLDYAAALEDGGALPVWMQFDPEHGELSGLAAAGAAQTLRIRITATDEGGLAVSTILEISFLVENQTIVGTAGSDLLRGGVGDDVLDASDDDDALDKLYGGAGDDLLIGGSGSDELYGEDGHDALQAGPWDTRLEGGAGNDHYLSGQGSDTMYDVGGDDTYVLSGGQDSIQDLDGDDAYYITLEGLMHPTSSLTTLTDADGRGALYFEGVQLTQSSVRATSETTWQSADGRASLTKSGGDLVIASTLVGYTGQVLVKNFFSTDVFLGLKLPAYVPPGPDPVNNAPVAGAPLAVQQLDEDAAWSFVVPADAFSDPDGDALSLTTTLADGSALPQWLVFDAATRAFSGTPRNADVGSLSIRLTATDPHGESAAQTFTLAVANVNDAPEAGAPLADQGADQDAPFVYLLPADAFSDPDGDALVFTATLADGTALPDWLGFDAATGTFSGTPGAADAGSLALRVTATDPSGATAQQSFTLAVRGGHGGNGAPQAGAPLPAQSVDQDAALSFVVPADAFFDPNGDALAFTATLADGAALPAWLSFDAATRTFSGTPGNADVGSLAVRITATDPSGAFATQDFTLEVVNVNDAPTTGAPLPAQQANEDAPFMYVLPADAFHDPDGDALVFTAALADGSALPLWLGFDAGTGTFSGTPAQSDVGSLHLLVTATDPSGTFATQDFVLQIANVNDAPVAGTPLPAQSAQEGRVFSYVIAPEAFSDPDGDVLSLSVARADGSALPAWLSFDAATGTLSGKPGQFDVGSLSLRVTASDGHGASASQALQLGVTPPPNSTPTVAGTAGTNLLLGGSGRDVISGGKGDDLLLGGSGDDVYLYRSGDGNDRIVELLLGGNDTLRLLDLNPDQIRIVNKGLAGAQVIDTTTGHTIELDLGLGPIRLPQQGVERIEFADGTLWERPQIVAVAESSGHWLWG